MEKRQCIRFSRKLKNNKPKQGRTEEKQLFLLEK